MPATSAGMTEERSSVILERALNSARRNHDVTGNDLGTNAVCLRGAASSPGCQGVCRWRGRGARGLAVIGAARFPALAKLHDPRDRPDARPTDFFHLSPCLSPAANLPLFRQCA